MRGSNVPKRSGRPKVYGDEFRNNVLEKIGAKPQMGLPRAREGT